VPAQADALKRALAHARWAPKPPERWFAVDNPKLLQLAQRPGTPKNDGTLFAVRQEMQRVPETQMNRAGTVLTSQTFTVAVVPAAEKGADAAPLRCRFMLKKVLESDLVVPEGVPTRRGMRGGGPRFFSWQLGTFEITCGGHDAASLDLGQREPLGDGEWHAVEVVVEDPNKEGSLGGVYVNGERKRILMSTGSSSVGLGVHRGLVLIADMRLTRQPQPPGTGVEEPPKPARSAQ